MAGFLRSGCGDEGSDGLVSEVGGALLGSLFIRESYYLGGLF